MSLAIIQQIYLISEKVMNKTKCSLDELQKDQATIEFALEEIDRGEKKLKGLEILKPTLNSFKENLSLQIEILNETKRANININNYENYKNQNEEKKAWKKNKKKKTTILK